MSMQYMQYISEVSLQSRKSITWGRFTQLFHALIHIYFSKGIFARRFPAYLDQLTPMRATPLLSARAHSEGPSEGST